MIITISGRAGSGKSTIAGLVAEKLNLRHYSTGDLMRDLAKERGLSLIEFGRLAEKDPNIDRQLDERQKNLGKTDNFVMDGRLSAYFIPNADLRVFLRTDDPVRAERILKNNRKDETNKDIHETLKNIYKREESEMIRYKKYYDIDYCDEKLYNFIIDTTTLKIEEVVDMVVAAAKNPKTI